MLKSKFCSFRVISLLSRVGGWVGGVGGEKLKIKLNSAQLELDLGLSLAKKINTQNSGQLSADRWSHALRSDQFCLDMGVTKLTIKMKQISNIECSLYELFQLTQYH
jgi:hypothetical protein